MSDRAAPMPLRILPDPDRPYSALKNDLVRLGWVWANESQVLPILKGEPEWVLYKHPKGGKLRYDFNPAIRLREIEVEGPAELLKGLLALSRLGPFDVARLLDGPDVETILRGLFAARALRLMPLLGKIHALCHHTDELVRRVAADVAQTLPVAAVSEAWERFQSLRAAHPERSALLAMMPVADRRQVLRWMGRDFREANADIVAALRAGLADDDAEVRATAALVAAKLGARDVRAAVEAMELPALVEDARTEAVTAFAAEKKLKLAEPTDDATLLLHALLEPLPAVPSPPSLPRHLRAESGLIRLARSGIEVALVASTPHWLGSSSVPQSPLRKVTARPFAVGAAVLDARAAAAVGAPVSAEGPLLLTLQEAKELIRKLGALEGVVMALPDEEAWEMALRGPDGRRFTAGNLAPEAAVSPWGAVALPIVEWTSGGARDGGDLQARPGPRERGCARFAMAFPV